MNLCCKTSSSSTITHTHLPDGVSHLNVHVTCTCMSVPVRPPLWLPLARPSPTRSIRLPSCFHPLPCFTTGANYFLCRCPFRKPNLGELVRIYVACIYLCALVAMQGRE